MLFRLNRRALNKVSVFPALSLGIRPPAAEVLASYALFPLSTRPRISTSKSVIPTSTFLTVIMILCFNSPRNCLAIHATDIQAVSKMDLHLVDSLHVRFKGR